MDVKTAARTLDLFEAFAELGRPATLTELAQATDMPVSSCFALVRTLEARGYLFSTKDRGPLYPTGRLMQIAAEITANDPVTPDVLTAMDQLRDELDETIVLGTLRGARVIYLHVAPARRPVRYAPGAGSSRPAHANSIGRAILAAMSADRRRVALGRMRYDRMTDETPTNAAALDRLIDEAAARGWAMNIGESDSDLAAVAHAVTLNGMILGMSVGGPRHRIAEAPPERIAKALARTCRALESRMDAAETAAKP